jgi:hypothetical protein
MNTNQSTEANKGGAIMSDLLQRLRGYNPPDRTIEEQRQISVDIYEAADRIEALEAELERAKTDRDEFKQCFNDALALAQTNFEKFTAAEAELERVGQDARQPLKLFLWCDPYRVSYGSSMIFAVAASVEAAREIAAQGKAYKYGEYEQERSPGELAAKLKEPNRVLELPCAEWHEWSE